MRASTDVSRIFIARSLRGVGDGCAAVLMPVYLSELGFSPAEIGAISSVMLAGAALLLMLLGAAGHVIPLRSSLLAASGLVVLTGVNFAFFERFWPLVLAALVGTINPSGGENNVFRPIEQTILARTTAPSQQTAIFARYSLLGVIVAGIGASLAGLPHWLAPLAEPVSVAKGMFLGYAALGLACVIIYRQLDSEASGGGGQKPRSLGPSRRRVVALTSLLMLDALGGGFLLNSVLVLWLTNRFDASVAAIGTIFLFTALCSAVSLLLAVPIARRFGLVPTIVGSQMAANVMLISAALAPTFEVVATFLVLRSLATQMDVPARAAYLMGIVTPEERAAAAAFTTMPFLLAAACGPVLAGLLLQRSSFAWPLLIGAGLKLVYDVLFLIFSGRISGPAAPGNEPEAARPS